MRFWNSNLEKIAEIEILDKQQRLKLGVEVFDYSIKSFDVTHELILIGYEKNLIVLVDFQDSKRNILTFSPFEEIGQIGLMSQSSKNFAIVSKDQFIRFYQTEEPQRSSFINSIMLQNKIISIDI